MLPGLVAALCQSELGCGKLKNVPPAALRPLCCRMLHLQERVLTRSDALEPPECLSSSGPAELRAGEIAQECALWSLEFSVQLELGNGAQPKDLSCSSALLLWW